MIPSPSGRCRPSHAVAFAALLAFASIAGSAGAQQAPASATAAATAAAEAGLGTEELEKLLAEGLGPRDAAARLVIVTGKPRRQLYQLALSLREKRS